MSKKYIPLYTKYRPMVFADITGQESTVKALSNAIESGRIMHAYLFCGPRGTGKTSSARIFAKSLNCVNGPTVTPCGKCAGCLDVINSTPVDVIEIDAASNRSVEDARNILEKVQYAPLHGKYKIYIIDEVHMLTTEASNTLLKTLEEPPENVIFILATTESHKVLETIVSRCQRYDFRRITTADIVKRLSFIAKSENIQIDEEALLAVAKNAAGGMRDAVALLDQLSVLGQNRSITIEDVNEILGRISYDTIYELAECISGKNTEKALKILNEIHDRGNEPSRVLTALIQYFRDMLILKSCSDKDLVLSMTGINEEIFDKIKEQSEKFNTQTLIYFADRLSYHFGKLKENTNKYMWAELCIIDLTSTEDVPTIAELTQKVAMLEARINGGHIPQAAPIQRVAPQPTYQPKSQIEQKEHTAYTPSQKEVQPTATVSGASEPRKAEVKQEAAPSAPTPKVSRETDDMRADWAQITAEIKGPAKFFFSKIAKPIEVNSHKIVIAFSNEGAAKQANDPSKKSLLQAAACGYYDVTSIQVEIKVGSYEVKKKPDDEHPLTKELEKPSAPVQEHKRFEPPKQFASPLKEEKIAQTPAPTSSQSSSPAQSTVTEEDVPPSEPDFTENYDDLDSISYNMDIPERDEATKKAMINELDISDTAKNILELFDGKITN